MSDLVEVRLLELPVAGHQFASQHIDELLREFSYLDAGELAVPARLLGLRHDLQARFGAFTAGPGNEIGAAVERGLSSIDLTYRIPPEVGGLARQAVDLLEEADEYCRQGDHLLTLAAPPAAVKYRRWFFGEFTRQCAGEAPIPWPAFTG